MFVGDDGGGYRWEDHTSQRADEEGSPLSAMVEIVETQHKLVQTDRGLVKDVGHVGE